MYKYKDVYEFQELYPTKEEKERVLATLDDEEIWHLAHTCGTTSGAAWYSKHMKNPQKDGQK